MRYFGGFFGRIPSARLTTLFMNPLGFFKPDSSVRRACKVPEPPPPAAPPIMNLLLAIVAFVTSDLPGSDK